MTEQVGNATITKQDAENGKVCAILLYILWIVGIIWYFVDEKQKNNPFTKFHLKQSLVLVIVCVAINIVTCGFGGIIGLVFAIIGLINAVNGETKELPIIGKFAEQWFKF